jgi:ribosomal protein S18 acetylase RimI-like enzyme
MRPKLPPGYSWCLGSKQDKLQIYQWLAATFQESFPEYTHWDHLQTTVDNFYDPPQTPCWWIHQEATSQKVGCVWAGPSRDQVTGARLAYLFMVRVDPDHRQQGLGQSLLHRIEEWAKDQQLSGSVLQVFAHNLTALDFYTGAGYQVQGYWLHKGFH